MNKKEILLVQVMEEAAEIIQAASKCIRFSAQHKATSNAHSNLEQLQIEVTDLITVLYKLGLEFPELTLNIQDKSPAKFHKIDKYHEISKELGTLNG